MKSSSKYIRIAALFAAILIGINCTAHGNMRFAYAKKRGALYDIQSVSKDILRYQFEGILQIISFRKKYASTAYKHGGYKDIPQPVTEDATTTIEDGDWYDDRPFRTLWVDGNHENFDMLKVFPVEEWHGGKIHRIRPNVLHLMRGQLFDIDGFTFFTMGGAASHDIQDGILDPSDPFFEEDYARMSRDNLMFRVRGCSWWQEELPSYEEYKEALATLKKANWKVDYVISHCAPSGIVKQMGDWLETDKLTDFFDTISKKLEFQYWLFGHYHDDGQIGQNYVVLYHEILRIE